MSDTYLDDPVYAPVREEGSYETLEVQGELPKELFGTFARNMSSPRFAPEGRYHWFDGDGMIHAAHIEDGRASLHHRWVRTAGFQAEEQEGRALWTGLLERPDMRRAGGPYKDTANTDLIFHAGQLLCLWWLGGTPYVVWLPDLETTGQQTYGGRLKHGVSAHPKIDPRTGEMMFIDYGPRPPFLTHGVISKEGDLVREVEIELPGPRPQHDIAITERFTVLIDVSMMADPELLKQGREKMRFFRDKPTRFGLLPRHGEGSQVRWFDAEPCYIYHVVNAWEDGDEVVLVGCRITNPLVKDEHNDSKKAVVPALAHLRLEPYLYRWTFNLETGATREEQLDDMMVEFPRIDDDRMGVRTRYSYSGRIPEREEFVFDAIVKHDTDTGARQVWEYPDDYVGGEVSFAPREGGDEDDGWVMTFATQRGTGKSELVVLDAKDMAAGPVARVLMPTRVPLGFHSRWIPGALLATQRGTR